MTAAEFGLWSALWSLDPWGEERADLRAGIIASTEANCHRGSNQAAFKAADFMPDFDPQEIETQPTDITDWIKQVYG